MPKSYPKEFRDDVVRVARNREPGQHLRQIAADFGISESCLINWMRAADVEDGITPGSTAGENAELREARKRIRLLEQKSEVLRGAAAYRRPHSPPSVVSPRCRRPRATPPPPSFEIR
ncbi:transposase [Rhodococcus rhodochrous J45]|uniref:Transposase n=1 Tax=Rhodococcus rhodochrous J45 TaxID=935266 RepID=A0A562DIG4_RHORH|nr:transposase [Rhodococcus rhodochrous J45]